MVHLHEMTNLLICVSCLLNIPPTAYLGDRAANTTLHAATLTSSEPGIAKEKKEEISSGVRGHARLEKF